MNCARCNAPLNNSYICIKCGREDRTAKRIIHTSNAYYNAGLQKVQLNDLTGSITSLRNSLKYNKSNKDARNLLGLVYFRMGEVIMALSEWVISVNLSPNGNRAKDYIDDIKNDRERLSAFNESISRYNTGLSYINDGNTDFAVLELKKAINLNPYFLKAYQLLGLIYINAKQYDAARTVLVRALKIDRNNPVTLRYIKEVSDATGIKVKRQDIKTSDFDEIKDPNPLVIQGEKGGAFADFNTGRFSLVNLLIGIIIGAAAIGLLLIPSIRSRETARYNAAVVDYSSTISSRNKTISNLNARLSDIEDENSMLIAQMEQYATYTDEGGNDDMLSQAVKAYLNGDVAGAGLILADINKDQLDFNSSKDVYEFLVNETRESTVDGLYVDAITNYNNEKYTEALDGFRRVINLSPDYGDAYFYTGMAYLQLADRTNARQYFEEFTERFPNNSHINEARERLQELSNQGE